MKMDQHYYNVESNLMESLRTHDSSLPISSKIDSLLDEFAGELTLLKLISPKIDETDCDFEENIRLIEKLLYDNSSSRPPEEFVSAKFDAEIESFSPSPILFKDNDSLMEEIDLSCTLDYPMPSGIEDDDYDSERDILILKDPSNNTLSFAEKESFHFDIPSFSRPPAKPPYAFCYMPDDDSWTEQSYLGCSSFPFLSPLIHPSMGGISILGYMKTLAMDFVLKSSSPLFKLGITLQNSFLASIRFYKFPPRWENDPGKKGPDQFLAPLPGIESNQFLAPLPEKWIHNSKALVTIDGEDIDWSGHVEEDAQKYVMTAYSSNNLGSENEASDLEDTSVNDIYANGVHAAPPPMTGNYMPSGPDVEIDYSEFTYGPKQTSVDESNSKPMWTDAPIIEEYGSDSDNDSVSNVQEDKEKSSFAFTDSVKHVNTSRENVKELGTPNHSPKIKKQGKNGHTKKGLGYAFTRKACFDDPHRALKDKGIVDSRCSMHMSGNKAHLADYQEFKGGSVAFGGSNGRITGKGKIKAGRLDFEDVYYVKELKHYNLFSMLQMCDKKNKVLFTDTDCLVLSPEFKLPGENQVILKIPRQHNMYSFNLKNIDPSGDLACLFAKASNKWHRRLGHVNFKNLNKLVKGNLVRGLPSKIFENDHTCVAYQKGKQHKASYLFLPATFWAEAVNTACYVLNRVLVTKPQNKTPYELLTGKQPILSYLRPFGFHVTILNTIDQLGKFDGKSDSGVLVGYSLNSKAFRVYNLETKRVEENLHVNFLENKPNVAGKGHEWMFDLDYLTNSMNYKPVLVENQANKYASPKEANNSAGTQANDDQSAISEEIDLHEEHFVLPIWSAYLTTVKSSGDKIEKNTDFKTSESLRKEATHDIQNANTSSTNLLNTVSTPLSTAGHSRAFNDGELSYPDDPSMPHLEDIYASPSEEIFTDSSYDDEGVVSDFNNLETTTRSKVNKNSEAHAFVSYIQKQQRNNHKDFQHYLFACFLSQIKPKKISQALEDKSWVDSMQEELLYQEEEIDYDEVFAHVARIEAIRIFLAFASYMGFIVYQMDVKSAFLYGTIDEEVYVSQPLGFVDPKFPNKVYKAVKALYGLHQALGAWYATLSTFLEKSGYRRGAIDKTLFIKKDKKNIMLVQVYVDDIIFSSTKKSWCDAFEELMKNKFQMSSMGELTFFLGFRSSKKKMSPIETQKPLVKDEEAADVDVHLYRFQVTPKTSHLQDVKRIFRRLISWQCKKQTIMATSTTEAEYVAAVHCCGQVLWFQNQLLDYGFNFMNINIYIDNESTICIVKNPVFHSKTKHIEIRHHFIRDAYKKKLIHVLKIHTDDNVADFLTKAFDVSMFNFLVVSMKDMIIYLKNMVGFKMNYFKGMTYSEIRPLFEKHFNYNQAFLEEVNEEVTLPEKEVEVEAHKREGESLEKDVTKKQNMDEEAEDLKSHLQIVANDDDDVYTEATPLASKIPVVDYKIHFERNKPYFKIIRADGNHKLFLSFSTMLKNFDKEDSESLWKLVKERFEKTEPKNYSDDYLLKTLRIIFEQLDVKASVWRDQKGRYGLAKRYPLTHFTLEQMLNNVRLEVEEVSEMSLELLRLVRRQLIEGYMSS
nr:hypothetical protein [Tanacetum cinerariifolium]